MKKTAPSKTREKAAALPLAFRRLREQGARLVALAPQRRIDISATEIRARVAQGLPIDHLTPPAVARLIARDNIYAPKRRARRSAGKRKLA